MKGRAIIKKGSMICLIMGICICSIQGHEYKTQQYQMEESYPVVKFITPEGKTVKNVVLMIGDGMSLMHVYTAWTANKGHLYMVDNCQTIGLSKTYCKDQLITDSGAGGTAMSTGEKGIYHGIAMNEFGKPLRSIMDYAQDKGLATGVVVSCRLNDATPATFCANNLSRNAYYDIVSDYVTCNVDFIMGGGSKYFINRPDHRNLFHELAENDYQVAQSWQAVDSIKEGRVFAVFDSLDWPVPKKRGDLLARGSLKALEILHQNKQGFFLMIEASQIDDYGHFNDLQLLMEEVHDFDKTVGAVLEWAAKDGETLVIVTADHETGGLTLLDGNLEKGIVEATFSTTGHSGVMVPVYTFGPDHEQLAGIYENTDIFKRIMKLLNL